MTAYQRGDVDAFAELVARHEKPLWNYLRRFVRDNEAAEDLLQETFMRVIRGSAEWRESAKFTTWLYTIGRNLCIDHARRQSHRRALSLDGQPERGSDAPPAIADRLSDGDPGGERRALDRELGSKLDQAIAQLPEPQREVFMMRELLELSFAEIAEAVGASEPTVKSRMRYALERLREALQDERASFEVLS